MTRKGTLLRGWIDAGGLGNNAHDGHCLPGRLWAQTGLGQAWEAATNSPAGVSEERQTKTNPAAHNPSVWR